MSRNNWRGLWLGAIILAQKMSDDKPLKTSSFAKVVPMVTKQQLRDIERSMLKLLDYCLHVRPLTYARYYFELHSLFVEIASKDSNIQWTLKPMSIADSMKLELRSLKFSNAAAEIYQNKESSTSGTESNSSNTVSTSTASASVLGSDQSSIRSPHRQSSLNGTPLSSNKPLYSKQRSQNNRINIRDETDATRRSSNSRFVLS